MQLYVQVSPGSSNPFTLVSPDGTPGGHNGSVTLTALRVWFPSLVTVTVYVMGSPAFTTIGTDGDLWTVMCGATSAVTEAAASPATGAP